MWLVTRTGIGTVALDRLMRDRMVVALHADGALPADIESDSGLRAASLAHAVPSHTSLTGLGALWVRGIGPSPRTVIVAAPPGAHRVGSPGLIASTLRTSGGTVDRSTGIAGVRCAAPADAAADALRWERLDRTYPVLAAALRSGEISDAAVDEAIRIRSPKAPGFRRMAEAWEALAGALA